MRQLFAGAAGGKVSTIGKLVVVKQRFQGHEPATLEKITANKKAMQMFYTVTKTYKLQEGQDV